MLSNGTLERSQLAAALEAQRAAGSGRIGEWLQKFGYANETDVTRALSIQWAVPMLAVRAARLLEAYTIPRTLLIAHEILPVHYGSGQTKLYLASCNEIDRSMLYQVEQMLGCAVVPCVAAASVVRKELSRIAAPSEREITFDTGQDCIAMARICCSYAMQLQSAEMRAVRCGRFIWVRLQRDKDITDLVFRLKETMFQQI